MAAFDFCYYQHENMAEILNTKITKSDLLKYREGPMHLWAEKNDRIEKKLSALELHIMEQGKEVEKLARVFLQEHLISQGEELDINFQATLIDGHFEARIDALVFDKDKEVYDLYEIKSSTSIKLDKKWDITFQTLVAESTLPVRNVYFVLLNKDYVKEGEIDISQLFVIANADEIVAKYRDEILAAREAAFHVASQDSPKGIEACHKPSECVCVSLCHAELPDYPIYDLPGIRRNKVNELRELGVFSIDQIPDDFAISDRQWLYANVAKRQEPLIDRKRIQEELDKLEYPLYFLDYEAYNPAIPLFDGYKPYQYITFQYSLHVLRKDGEELEHFEYLLTENKDPALDITKSLMEVIGETGSIIVWHKTFEKGRHDDLAKLVPDAETFFTNLNDRVYDLKEIFSKGYYIHPDFHGSASIKKVLPVLVGDFEQNYESLSISKGDVAMMTWLAMINGLLPPDQLENTKSDMLEYCKLDTIAMVKNWEAIENLSSLAGLT